MAESTPAATRPPNRSKLPTGAEFRLYMSSGWDLPAEVVPAPRTAAPYAAARRARLSALHPGRRLIIPAGPALTRANDTEHPYRAHSAFAHLTGWGSDTVPGSVLVLEPTADGHDATLYLRSAAPRDSSEFYANPAIGEFWNGPIPSPAHVAGDLGIATRDLRDLNEVLESTTASTLILREADRDLTDQIDGRRLLAAELDSADIDDEGDRALAADLSELRLVKDEFEQAELRTAIAATARGFDEIVADLPAAMAHERGERVVEGTFDRRARIEGNTVGYSTIAASGPHACYLHWTRNDGPVRPGDLLLVDAGVEVESLYTADITRTIPVSGVFSPEQRRVYDAVQAAADAARAIVRPGIRFHDVHAAAMAVIAATMVDWGLVPGTLDEELADGQHHRRYMIHGTSHHLGLDVHDCAKARQELYMDGILEAGMVFTIEPGLYFQADDLTVPAEYRGIGVRIEDNVLVTDDGCELLSAEIPRTADDIEAWVARLSR
jgi:Xaa-Pro aminopeptidase